MEFDPNCRAYHFGLIYAINPKYLEDAVEAIRNQTWAPRALQAGPAGEESAPPYELLDGMACIPIQGPIMRGASKLGGTSSIAVRNSLRAASRDPAVKGVMLLVDSPGGSAAGTDELASEIQSFIASSKKPVYAHIEGMAASAAYWAIAYASKITASRSALVGNIGVYSVLKDTSKAAEMQGVKVQVVGSGPLKGADTPGAPITPELVAETQNIVNSLAQMFFEAVKAGRNLGTAEMNAVKDGSIYPAGDAKKLGLIDAVQGLDATVNQLREKSLKRVSRTQQAELNTRLAEI